MSYCKTRLTGIDESCGSIGPSAYVRTIVNAPSATPSSHETDAQSGQSHTRRFLWANRKRSRGKYVYYAAYASEQAGQSRRGDSDFTSVSPQEA